MSSSSLPSGQHQETDEEIISLDQAVPSRKDGDTRGLHGNVHKKLHKRIRLLAFLSNEYSVHFPVSEEVNKEEAFCWNHGSGQNITTKSFRERAHFSSKGNRVLLIHGLNARSSSTHPYPGLSLGEESCFSLDLKQHIRLSSKRSGPYDHSRVSLIDRLRS